MFRKHYTLTFEPTFYRQSFITEKRSIPWIVWFIDKWFMWAHEWPYLINKEKFVGSRWAKVFCYPYTLIADWSFGYERIDDTEECFDHA